MTATATMTGDPEGRPDGASEAAEPRWLSLEEQHAWRGFIYGASAVLEYLSQVLERDEEISLTLHEYEILVRLSETERGRMRMSELADQIVHSRSRLTHTVARLEKRGLLIRERCSVDGRGREAVLTDEGMALLERAAPVHVASVREAIVEPLGSADFVALGELMRRVRRDDQRP